MRKLLLGVCAVCLLAGCNAQEDPTKRPGFVDTSDPSKAMSTMTAPPKTKVGVNVNTMPRK
jgi:uncharacterized lipoprotein